MNTFRHNSKGFGTIELLLILVVVAVLAGAGIYLYHKDHKPKALTTGSTTQTNKTNTTPQPQPSPYAGWNSATLKYEAASFKYPSTWKISSSSTPNGTAGTVSPGSDQVTLTSPGALEVTIKSGTYGIGDGPYYGTILSTMPITTLGGSYYLGFGTDAWGTGNKTNSGCVGTSSGASANFPYSKNITIPSPANPGDKPFDVVCMIDTQATTASTLKTVADFEADPSFDDAKLIVQSLSY